MKNNKSKESESNKLLVVNNDYYINKEKGKLMIDEEIKNGKINSKIYKTIVNYSGGYLYIIFVFIFAILWQFTLIYGNMYLTNWSDKNPKGKKDKKENVDEISTILNIDSFQANNLNNISLIIKYILMSK